MGNVPATTYFRLGLILTMTLNLFSASTVWGVDNPSAILVEKQSFYTSDSDIRHYHGYCVLRFKLSNTDIKQTHTAVISDGGATRTVQLAPGEKQIVSFFCSPKSALYSSVKISFSDSNEWQIFNFSSRDSWSDSSIKKNVSEPISILVCRSLRSTFLSCSCSFADKDCRYWPSQRMDYSSFDIIVLSLDELASAPEKVQQAIYHFVLSGGTLYLFNTEEHKKLQSKISWLENLSQQTTPKLIPAVEQGKVLKESEPEIHGHISELTLEETDDDDNDNNNYDPSSILQCPINARVYNAGFGSVFLCGINIEKYLSRNNVSDKLFMNRLASVGMLDFCADKVWFATEPLEETHNRFAVANNLDIPRRGISIAMILFVLLAGPINVFILMRRNQRILLLITVPILSFIFAGGIVLYVMTADGFQTDIRVCSTTCLDQRNSTAVTIAQVGYYARTAPRNLIFDINTEIQPFTEMNFRQHSAESSNRIELLPGSQVFSSHWVKPRTPTYFRMRKTETTRLKMSFDFNSNSPSVVNGFGRDAALMYVRDAQGKLWKAEELKAGQKVLLVPVKPGEKSTLLNYNDILSANQTHTAATPLMVNANLPKAEYNSQFQSYFFIGDWYKQKNLANRDFSLLTNNSYVVLMKNAGPFIEKGIRYANEKDCQTIIYGLY